MGAWKGGDGGWRGGGGGLGDVCGAGMGIV